MSFTYKFVVMAPFIYGLLVALNPPKLDVPGLVPEKPHITIVYLGYKFPNVPGHVPLSPFTAYVKSIEPLPSRSKPRHVVLMLEPTEPFIRIRELLGIGSDRYGEFRPHISLYAVRAKYHWDYLADLVVPQLKGLVGLRIVVDRVQLIDTGGGIYRVIREIPLLESDRGFLHTPRNS